MRLTIHNASKAPDSMVLPLIRFAAKFFNVSGRVNLRFSETREMGRNEIVDRSGKGVGPTRQKIWGGFCQWSSRVPQIVVRSTLNPAHPRFPVKMERLSYFPSSKIAIKPYEVRNPEEVIVHVAAHEFAHLMKSGNKFRMSRREVFCENRATEVLEAFRTAEGQTWVAQERAAMTGEGVLPGHEPRDVVEGIRERENELREQRLSRLANIRDRLKRWRTKAKRAKNAIRKLEAAERRTVKTLEDSK